MESVRAIEKHWWWALASGAQFGWALFSFRKGCAGDSRLMPLKAFAVASLFVGAAASASFSALQASGIHKVEDLMEVGANIRTGLGIRSRVREEEK
ncbi:putative StAR-related lipid transfer protein 9 [Tripterygium wilfordii]|uniref:Putative StAR-related lipid transfer protein 9 n=2 Tax=Tripterygium wilfordii TaxID=458696 RepID=A0A7J7CFH5_TRIWF|nr:putative StAR-related lipid transfer protein 9 [Tripterygium wilfordii]